jgi:protein-tyrosine phosphatase
MLITEAVQVWREADGDYWIEWQASQPDTEVLLEPLVPEARATAHRIGTEPQSARVSGLPLSRRHFFRLTDQHGNAMLATERKLGMDGAPNFRDFGGYQSADGRQVKWGYLFRSGHLCDLSDRDLDLLSSLELDLICDFRREEEQLSEPSRLPARGRRPRIASLPIVPGSNGAALDDADYEWGGRDAMFEFMVAINRDFATDETGAYARMFREILELDDARLLLHCAAGKDRTGFGAAIILLALGVPEATVMQDYLLTGRFFEPVRQLDRIRRKYQLEQLAAEAILPMLEVHEDYLNMALSTILAGYGSVETYLREALRLGSSEVAELRRRYLE